MIDVSTKEDAIQAALEQNWHEAIRLNTELIKIDKTNTDSWNRLGYAFLKDGQIKKAKETFEKVIKIDPYNQIALKNLKKLPLVRKANMQANQSQQISPLLFLEDPGKTKVIDCINPAPMNVLSALCPGQEVSLICKRHGIEVRDTQKKYIAALPDDIAFRLLKLLTAGNEYTIFIKGISKNTVTVFVREMRRGKKLLNQPSFIGLTNYIPFQQSPKNTDSTLGGESEDGEERPEEENA